MRRVRMLVAALAAAALAAALSSCANPVIRPTPSVSTSSSPQPGSVAVFVPSDGPTISQHRPLNAWTSFTPDLTKALENQGFAHDDISVKSSDSLDGQSRDIQDYVVNTLSAADESSSAASPSPSSEVFSATPSAGAAASPTSHAKLNATIIVAPVAQVSPSSAQYGDYATRPITARGGAVAGSTDSGSTDEKRQDQDEQTLEQVEERLTAALQLARESGVRIIVVSNPIRGFKPDLFVQMSTARQIGAAQARLLASKLQLDKVSRDNPKSIEILLPVTGAQEGDDDDADLAADAFAEEAFAGVWGVLEPYVANGKVVSPSGSFNASTTPDDWRASAFDADKTQQVQDEIDARLGMARGSGKHTRIDGIVAMNDFVASGVIAELGSLQYTGSAADVNPSITISGIVNNMTGRKDLARQAVPDPVQQAVPQNGDTAESLEKVNSRWPIVTGYGAYRDTIAQIVDGKLWMTALENRQALTTDIAQACVRLNSGETLGTMSSVEALSIDGVTMPAIHEQLLAVSASNLKRTLIDPGYISLADAGL